MNAYETLFTSFFAWLTTFHLQTFFGAKGDASYASCGGKKR
jgi:hypothetical protein